MEASAEATTLELLTKPLLTMADGTPHYVWCCYRLIDGRAKAQICLPINPHSVYKHKIIVQEFCKLKVYSFSSLR